MTNQQAPYSQSAEESVIGAVLTNPLYYLNIAAFLKPEDFFILRHHYIWAAIGRLEARHEPIDTLTVSNELQAHNQLAEIGGPAYLTQLINNTPTSTHAEVYGALVSRAAKRRALMIACDEIKLSCIDETIDWKQVGEQAESKVLSVTASEQKQEETNIGAIAHSYMDSVEKLVELRQQGITPGIPTGYKDIDNINGGSYKGELTVIAGPAKLGKSTYNLNVARKRAKLGATVVIFVCEMNREAIVRKFISMETGLSIATLKDAKFTAQEYGRFVEAFKKINKWNMHIIDEYKGLTPLDVRRELRKIMHKESVDVVLIDGLWLMRSNRPSDARHTAVSDIMKDLSEIAQKLNIPIDLVHQLKRAPGNRREPRPVLSDLGESIGVEQNAYTVIFLYRASYYKHDSEDDETEIIIAANRDGNTGIAKLGFDKMSETYRDLTYVSTRQPAPTLPLSPADDRKDIYQ
jgi:replicative DNA helicase